MPDTWATMRGGCARVDKLIVEDAVAWATIVELRSLVFQRVRLSVKARKSNKRKSRMSGSNVFATREIRSQSTEPVKWLKQCLGPRRGAV